MFSKPFVTAVAALSFLTAHADAYWRMSCPGTVFTGRVDPIVNPGEISSHVHIVLGGNGFAPNMTGESTLKATCTSCSIKGDMSNYWTPLLYYRAKNGSFISVPIAGGQGGTVYYQQRASYKGNNTITAFPRGFRMLAGTPTNREVDEGNTTQQAVNFACLDYSGNTHVPEGQLLPKVRCPNGVRAQVYFPQCWNGKDHDSHDHKSHMAYPSNYNGGDCPDSHPVPTMGLFYEFLYDTGKFDFYAPEGADQPFAFSMGDATGRGFHGDFISGWDEQILQNGINKKTTLDAGAAGDVTYQNIFEYPEVFGTACSLPKVVDEQVEGVLEKLPGCNPVTNDVADMHSAAGCGATTTLAVQTNQVFTDMTGQGWKYLGCGNDTYGANVLPTKVADSNSMTVQTCTKQCGDKGFSYAGLEFGSQCFCGNSLPAQASPLPDTLGNCHMRCSGDASQTCGDASRLSLYQSCKGGDCKNAFVGFVGQVGALSNNTGVDGAKTGSSTSGGNTSGGSSSDSGKSSPAASSPVASPVASSAAAPAGTPAPATPSPAAKQNDSPTGSDSAPSYGSVAPPGYGSELKPASSAAPAVVPAPASSPAPSSSGSNLPDGWTAAGCYTDSRSSRALTGINLAWWGQPITTSNCAKYCAGKGFTMAGTEFGDQCFCGNKLEGGSKKTDDKECDTKCKADDSQTCGGGARLSVVSTKATKRRASLA